MHKTKNGERFQNYRAYFTALKVEKGEFEPLQSEPTLTYRKKSEQPPSGREDKKLNQELNL